MPPAEALRVQQSLREDEAMSKLADYMSRKSSRAGLCEFTRNNWPQKGSVWRQNLVGINSGKPQPFLGIDFSQGLTPGTINQMNAALEAAAKRPPLPTAYPPLRRDGTSVVFFGESKLAISSVLGDNNVRTCCHSSRTTPTITASPSVAKSSTGTTMAQLTDVGPLWPRGGTRCAFSESDDEHA